MGDFHYQRDADNIVTVTMDMDGPVNVMNDACTQFMEATLTRLEAEKETLAGVIITSAKPTFFAGGDLKRIYALQPSQSAEFFHALEAKKSLLRRLEQLGKPVVAAINGTALGAGFEICLACFHRIAIDNPKTLLGLPEATLGLLPGAGGVVRTVHLLGLKRALPYLLEGTLVRPDEALASGLIDQLASDNDSLLAKARSWIKANPEVAKPWDQKGYQLPGGGANDTVVRRLVAGAIAQLSQQSEERLPAPEMILDVAVDATRVNFDTALRIESRALTSLVMTPQAKGLVAFKFLQASKEPVQAPEDYVARLSEAYHAEAARLLDELISPVLINAVARQAGLTRNPLGDDVKGAGCVDVNLADVRDRLLFSQVIEALHCWEQDLIGDVVVGNVGSVNGAGFPASLGGVFQCIDSYGFSSDAGTDAELGAAAFVRRADQLASQYGQRFNAPDLLLQKVETAATFW
ncbi:MAG: enoyl-CoA hydratase-related protein [Motiliproteus sp.]